MKCEIHKQIAEVCNDNITNEESVRKWFIMFNGGKSNVDNKECSGQLCVIDVYKRQVYRRRTKKS